MLRTVVLIIISVSALVAAIIGWNWWNHIRLHGTTTPIEFTSKDGTILRGDVYLPKGPGPHAGVVILLGSGEDSPQMLDYQMHANIFLKKGVAVLMYDKRGLGDSTGDFETATYADFVEDAIAGVKALRARPEILDGKIGLFGLSEGGWFTPEIAVRDGQIKFVINKAGSPFSGGVTYLWEIRNELIDGGINNQSLIASILDLRLRIWSYYRDAAAVEDPLMERRIKLEAELAALDGPWREIYPMGVAEFDAEKYRRWLIDIDYDPMPYLLKMTSPLYAMYASDDQNIPTEDSVAALKKLRRETGNDITIKVFPGRRHSFFKWYNVLTVGHPPEYLKSIGDFAAANALEA